MESSWEEGRFLGEECLGFVLVCERMEGGGWRGVGVGCGDGIVGVSMGREGVESGTYDAITQSLGIDGRDINIVNQDTSRLRFHDSKQ